MTNLETIERWHREKPDFVAGWQALHWSIAELVAEKLDEEAAPEPESCMKAPEGRYCVLQAGHAEPCHTYAEDGSD